MTRNRAAWPVLFVADRSAVRRIWRSSMGMALSASSDRNSSNVSGSATRPMIETRTRRNGTVAKNALYENWLPTR